MLKTQGLYAENLNIACWEFTNYMLTTNYREPRIQSFTQTKNPHELTQKPSALLKQLYLHDDDKAQTEYKRTPLLLD